MIFINLSLLVCRPLHASNNNTLFIFQIDVNQFITMLEVFQPDIAECLCDTVLASKQTEKRIRKSVDRTLIFLDQCLEEMAKKVSWSCK